MGISCGIEAAIESAGSKWVSKLAHVALTAPKVEHRSTTSPPASAELEFISVEEVARKLGGVCQRTIRRLSDAGDLCRPVKGGGRSMYPKQEVIDYMLRKMRERPQ